MELEIGIVCGGGGLSSPPGTTACPAGARCPAPFEEPEPRSAPVVAASSAPEAATAPERIATPLVPFPALTSPPGLQQAVAPELEPSEPAVASAEEPMEQARSYICKSCHSQVPPGHKF